MTGGKPKTNRYLERLRPVLDELGVEWRVVRGSRHDKVFVGSEMAAVIPRGSFVDGNFILQRKTERNLRAAAERQLAGQAPR